MRQLDEDRLVRPDVSGPRRHWRRIFATLAAFVLVGAAMLTLGRDLNATIMQWFCTLAEGRLGRCDLVFNVPFEAFLAQLSLATWAGMLAAWLVASFRFWKLYHPGLGPDAARSLMPLDLGAVAGFVLGAAIAVYAVIPAALRQIVAFLAPKVEALDPYQDMFLATTVLQENMKFALAIFVIFALLGQVPFLIAATRKAGRLARRLDGDA